MRSGAHLGEDDGNDGLGVDERGVAEVVQAAGGEDLRSSLPPNGLTEGHAVLGEQLWGHAAQGTQHGPASVDDLDLTVPAAVAHSVSQSVNHFLSSHLGRITCLTLIAHIRTFTMETWEMLSSCHKQHYHPADCIETQPSYHNCLLCYG